jgi:hypothetical protein
MGVHQVAEEVVGRHVETALRTFQPLQCAGGCGPPIRLPVERRKAGGRQSPVQPLCILVQALKVAAGLEALREGAAVAVEHQLVRLELRGPFRRAGTEAQDPGDHVRSGRRIRRRVAGRYRRRRLYRLGHLRRERLSALRRGCLPRRRGTLGRAARGHRECSADHGTQDLAGRLRVIHGFSDKARQFRRGIATVRRPAATSHHGSNSHAGARGDDCCLRCSLALASRCTGHTTCDAGDERWRGPGLISWCPRAGTRPVSGGPVTVAWKCPAAELTANIAGVPRAVCPAGAPRGNIRPPTAGNLAVSCGPRRFRGAPQQLCSPKPGRPSGGGNGLKHPLSCGSAGPCISCGGAISSAQGIIGHENAHKGS